MKEQLINFQAKAHAGALMASRLPSSRAAMQMCLMVCVGLMLSAVAMDAMAAGAMPWEGPLCAVANSMKSTVARAAAVIAIVICGLAMAFGEMNGIFKTLMGLIAGASMALLATQWLSFLGGGSSVCSSII